MTLTRAYANQEAEEGCFGTTFERKYFRVGNLFKKRSLRPDEWQFSSYRNTIHVPRLGKERLLNEAAALQYIKAHTDIPVPTLYSSYEKNGAVTLEMEYVEGVGMDSLDETQRRKVTRELEHHLDTLHGLRSSRPGGPSGIVIPPYRVTQKTTRDEWAPQNKTSETLVFCHNDLSMQNVIVDPVSLKIRAIIDWEYAGFFPVFFDRRFFVREGPSVAMEGEEDDSMALISYLEA
jgi:serine/threonine protein kinase